MASFEEFVRESLQCSICQEDDVELMLFPECQHTLCETCVVKLFSESSNKSIRCPECRQEVSGSEGTFRKFRFGNLLLGELKRQVPDDAIQPVNEQPCTYLGHSMMKQRPVDLYCMSCDNAMCYQCSRGQNCIDQNKHNGVPIDEILKQVQGDIEAQEMYCKQKMNQNELERKRIASEMASLRNQLLALDEEEQKQKQIIETIGTVSASSNMSAQVAGWKRIMELAKVIKRCDERSQMYPSCLAQSKGQSPDSAKKVYGREFLISLKTSPLSVSWPQPSLVIEIEIFRAILITSPNKSSERMWQHRSPLQSAVEARHETQRDQQRASSSSPQIATALPSGSEHLLSYQQFRQLSLQEQQQAMRHPIPQAPVRRPVIRFS